MRWLRLLTGLLALVCVAVALNLLILKEDLAAASVLGPLGLGLALGVLWIVLRVATATERYGKGKALYGINSAIATLAVLGIAVVLYAFASRWNVQWDLTQEGRRELAPQTKQVLQGLNQEVEVVGFFIDANDTFLDASRDKTIRFLDQAKSYSPRLKVEIVDPVKQPGRLIEFKLQEARLSPQGTVVLKSGMRQKVLPLSGVTARLDERDFTNALINVVRKSQPMVYLLQGHGERDPTRGKEVDPRQGALSFKTLLDQEGYKTDVLSLSPLDPKIPDDCDILVINSPQMPFRPQELTAIQGYMDNGGRALLLLDPLPAPLSLLPSWLEERYGAIVHNDWLINTVIKGQSDSPTALYLLPEASKVTTQLVSRQWPEEFPGCYNQEHPITRAYDKEMLLNQARSLAVAPKAPKGVVATEILHTLPFTYGETDLPMLMKGQAHRDPDEPEGWPAVGVAVAGKTGVTGETGQEKEARLILVGDGDISSNEGIEWLGNLNFLLNSMAWLSESEELIALRPTGKQDPPIILTKGEEQLVAWVATLGLLQAIAVAGVAVHLFRRRYQ